jgi:hypothetical protein
MNDTDLLLALAAVVFAALSGVLSILLFRSHRTLRCALTTLQLAEQVMRSRQRGQQT